LLAVGGSLLLACLLLLARLLACPSPPRLAPGWFLSFSSWDGLLVLLLSLILSFRSCPWFLLDDYYCLCAVEEQWCSLCGFPVGFEWGCISWSCPSSRPAAH
jgi:hypothetical protein